MGAKKITTTQGDKLNVILTFQDKAGATLDITGATVKMLIRNLCTEIIEKDVTEFTDAGQGLCTVTFTPAETLQWPAVVGQYRVGITLSDLSRYQVIDDIIEVEASDLWT